MNYIIKISYDNYEYLIEVRDSINNDDYNPLDVKLLTGEDYKLFDWAPWDGYIYNAPDLKVNVLTRNEAFIELM